MGLKAREAWLNRPIEPDPAKIEERFPADDLIAAEPECCEENCSHEVFRGLPRCRRCHLAWIASQELEKEALLEKRLKREKRKDFPEQQAMNAAKAATSHCSNCGAFMAYVDKYARLKPEDRRPKKPVLAKDVFEVICSGCAGSK